MNEQDYNRLLRELEKLNKTLEDIKDRLPVSAATYTIKESLMEK